MVTVEGYQLDEILDFSVVERLQNIYRSTTGMEAHLVDLDGKNLVQTPSYERKRKDQFCVKYVRSTQLGDKMCHACELLLAREVLENQAPIVNICHCGLVQFAVPIVVRGKMICVFAGGHVTIEPLEFDAVADLAKLYQLNFKELWESAKDLPLISMERARAAASEMYSFSGIIADMIENRIKALETEEQLKHADAVKSDFLANMSHEIRTPMNAVIGMSEMALRENIQPLAARDYISQIKNSGKALLSIINDILDFSKIESGKMEIVPVDYEPMSVFNDVTNIVMTRLVDKNVELMLDLDANIPKILHGDNLRIRQVLINIANNATKFTNMGHIKISIRSEAVDEKRSNLKVYVEDTGIGIREEDMRKLFNSFQQVDSKRNRNVEGTGLGLAISKNLVQQMGGEIGVCSTYGEGSTFYFTIPQEVVDASPSVYLNEDPKEYALAFAFENEDAAQDIQEAAEELGVDATILDDPQNPVAALFAWAGEHPNQKKYFIIPQSGFYPEEAAGTIGQPGYEDVQFVLLADTFAEVKQWADYPALKILKKPVSCFNLAALLNNVEYHVEVEKEDSANFEAPDAKVLIVDDNAVNLTVAKGLMEPLNMQVTTAGSGKEALDLISREQFDLIFMDHMMPDLDGVETTRIIRRMYLNYAEVPIIALTANAISGTKEMFLQEGMNDFVAKPIELRLLMAKIKQWLPPEKIHSLTSGRPVPKATESKEVSLMNLEIGDLDISHALQLLGTEDLFWTVLKEYYHYIPSKASSIEKHYREKDIANYTIEVHALKSASRQIGAIRLADLAALLEKAGNSRDLDTIERQTETLLHMYRNYEMVLAPFFQEKPSDEKNVSKEKITKEELETYFTKIREALDDLNLTEMEEICNQMQQQSFPEDQEAYLSRLLEATNQMDVDECSNIVEEWEKCDF
ncbi:MAG: PocR ligand-binding domain-containing protein [Lachnospiraceae bacterium]|nr:PocR ligand-binding domain-containing protein [Lachnospiraceae bacterium]